MRYCGIDVDDTLATYDVRYFKPLLGAKRTCLLHCTCLLLTQSGHWPLAQQAISDT